MAENEINNDVTEAVKIAPLALEREDPDKIEAIGQRLIAHVRRMKQQQRGGGG